jgi:hypothetical protein
VSRTLIAKAGFNHDPLDITAPKTTESIITSCSQKERINNSYNTRTITKVQVVAPIYKKWVKRCRRGWLKMLTQH